MIINNIIVRDFLPNLKKIKMAGKQNSIDIQQIQQKTQQQQNYLSENNQILDIYSAWNLSVNVSMKHQSIQNILKVSNNKIINIPNKQKQELNEYGTLNKQKLLNKMRTKFKRSLDEDQLNIIQHLENPSILNKDNPYFLSQRIQYQTKKLSKQKHNNKVKFYTVLPKVQQNRYHIPLQFNNIIQKKQVKTNGWNSDIDLMSHKKIEQIKSMRIQKKKKKNYIKSKTSKKLEQKRIERSVNNTLSQLMINSSKVELKIKF